MLKGNHGLIIRRSFGLAAGVVALAVAFLLSVKLGFVPVSWRDVFLAISDYDRGSMEQTVVKTARLPRAFIAAAVGASLALSGAIVQALTRNPLGSPSVLGINAGAALAVVATITLSPIREPGTLMWMAFGGAALAASAVYLLGAAGRDGLSPLRIILAGSALTAFFSAVSQGLLIRNEQSLQDILFWLTGSVAARPIEMLNAVLPYLLAGWIVSILLSRQLNVLLMDDQSAKGLGMRLNAVRLAGGVAVVIMAGGAVAVAGPIGLIGIIVPHSVKAMSGADYRWLIPYCAVFGATLLLLADVVARFVVFPLEVPVGMMTAAIGAPFFIALARRGLKKR